MSQVYQFPQGDHHPETQVDSARDAVNDIFENGVTDQVNDIFHSLDTATQSERDIKGAVEKIKQIGDSIASARKYRLDSLLLKKTQGRVRFISSAAKLLFDREISRTRLEDITEADLRSQESAICSNMFGKRVLPDNLEGHISFFNYDRTRWFLHDQVIDKQTKASAEVTFHYEVHPEGILCLNTRHDTPNKFLAGDELDNFVVATEAYYDIISRELYNSGPASTTINSQKAKVLPFPIRPINSDRDQRAA